MFAPGQSVSSFPSFGRPAGLPYYKGDVTFGRDNIHIENPLSTDYVTTAIVFNVPLNFDNINRITLKYSLANESGGCEMLLATGYVSDYIYICILYTSSCVYETGIISLIAVLAKNWNNMSPTEKVIASILAAASAVGILAVALGALAGGVGAGVVAASLAAGIAAATIAINAGKRAASAGYSGGYGGRSAYPMSAYAAVPYRMPMLATGTVVPPRAGMFAAILGDNNRETEVVSPLSTMKQALKEALAESNISGGNQIAKAELILDGTRFGQLVVKFGKNEKNRVGVDVYKRQPV